MKRLLGAVAALGILSLALLLVVDLRRPSQSVEISLLGTTNEDIGLPTVVFVVSNRTTRPICFGYETVIWTNQKWERFDVISESPPFGKSVSARSVETVEVFMPKHGNKWKVAVFYERQRTAFQRQLQAMLQRLGRRPHPPELQFGPEMNSAK